MDATDTRSLTFWMARGWSAFRRDPLPLMGGSVVLQAFSFGGILIERAVSPEFGLTLLILTSPVLSVGFAALCLRHVRGNDTLVTDVFGAFARFGTSWLTFVLYSLVMFVGLLFFIMPGLYWAAKFGLCPFAVMDRNHLERPPTVSEALLMSGGLTEGHVGKIFCLIVIMIIGVPLGFPFLTGLGLTFMSKGTDAQLILIGIVPFLLNLLVLTPWVWASLAAAYEGLSGRGETASG